MYDAAVMLLGSVTPPLGPYEIMTLSTKPEVYIKRIATTPEEGRNAAILGTHVRKKLMKFALVVHEIGCACGQTDRHRRAHRNTTLSYWRRVITMTSY